MLYTAIAEGVDTTATAPASKGKAVVPSQTNMATAKIAAS